MDVMMKTLLFCFFAALTFSCESSTDINSESNLDHAPSLQSIQKVKTNAVAYFASGCFWCVEAVFESVVGVGDVVSGYSGGTIKDPSYELICSGTTRHAEAVMVPYDSNLVSYETLLKVFFASHDPSTQDRQGPDRGPQYRSAIFYSNESEKQASLKYIKELKAKGTFSKITTEVSQLKVFYNAEDYHQNYERLNPNNPYVRNVSVPRLNNFKNKHPELLKKNH